MNQDFTWAELGNRIRDRRIARRLTQQTLAGEAKITQNGLFRIEAGEVNPQLASLQRIAGVLGCSVRELFCGKSRSDPQFAHLLQRVHRVIESGDAAAIQTIDNAVSTAELLLDRTGRRGLPPIVVKGEGRRSAADDLFWMKGSVRQNNRERSSVATDDTTARKPVTKAVRGFVEHA
jgi:transcriptional regulator with XRE-family HTH domain